MKHRPPMTPSGRNGNATPFARVERELIVVTEPTSGLFQLSVSITAVNRVS